jgi:hypothetical protein
MGVLLYSVNPRVASERYGDPPEDWSVFHTTYRNWAAIEALCAIAGKTYGVKHSLHLLDGCAKVMPQQCCDELAALLEDYLAEYPPPGDEIVVDETGKYYTPEEAAAREGDPSLRTTHIEVFWEWIAYLGGCGGCRLA